MPRIPFMPKNVIKSEELVASMLARRGGRLWNLDRMLLHTPPLAQGWNTYLGAVRGELGVPTRLMELAICGVAVLNDCEYEFYHHAPEFMKAGGSAAQVEGLRSLARTMDDPALFDATEQAVLRLTLEMTRSVRVSDETFAAAREALGDTQQMVELVGIIATYNMVSRFLVALDVEPEFYTGK